MAESSKYFDPIYRNREGFDTRRGMKLRIFPVLGELRSYTYKAEQLNE